VRGVVVHDEMDVETAWDGGLNLVEELAELDGAVAGLPMTFARRNVERREQRGRAVARVVVAAPRGLTGAHEVEADHIAHLGDESGSVESLNVSIR
jgi:hypothetical protein